MAPKVFTILVNWNGIDDTVECLQSLSKSQYSNNHIIVVDNGSKDDSLIRLEKLRASMGFELISNQTNLGYSPACNQGIEAALRQNADYIFLLNNDCTVAPSAISELIDACEQFPDLGIAGSVNYFYDDPQKICFAGGSIVWSTGLTTHATVIANTAAGAPNDVDYVTGAAMLLRSSMVRAIGPYEPRYFAYFEDTDLCVRARQSNWRVALIPRSKVWHKVSRSTGGHESLLQHYYGTRARLLFMHQHSGRKAFAVFCTTQFAYYLARKAAAAIVKPSQVRLKRLVLSLQATFDFASGRFGECRSELR